MIQKVRQQWIYSPEKKCPYYLDPKQVYSYSRIKEDLNGEVYLFIDKIERWERSHYFYKFPFSMN